MKNSPPPPSRVYSYQLSQGGTGRTRSNRNPASLIPGTRARARAFRARKIDISAYCGKCGFSKLGNRSRGNRALPAVSSQLLSNGAGSPFERTYSSQRTTKTAATRRGSRSVKNKTIRTRLSFSLSFCLSLSYSRRGRLLSKSSARARARDVLFRRLFRRT